MEKTRNEIIEKIKRLRPNLSEEEYPPDQLHLQGSGKKIL
jgi:hypothetical protein